jgi:hypothetical protein
MKKIHSLVKRWYMFRDLIGIGNTKCNYKTNYYILSDNADVIDEPNKEFGNALETLKEMAKISPPQHIDEVFDRRFIKQFIDDNAQYVKGDVLEFFGNKHYVAIVNEPLCFSKTYFQSTAEPYPR